MGKSNEKYSNDGDPVISDLDGSVNGLDQRSEAVSHELDAPPWLRVESTLMATARLIRKAYDSELAALDLNLTSASLLMYVVERGGSTQTVLARRLDVGRAAAGLVVDRLEKRGLVVRRSDVDDRRTWVVDATTAGRKVAAQVSTIDETVRGRLRNGVDRQARQELANLLLQMQENLLTPRSDD